jgi:O-antigen/teichoic acid export membrane protein
LNKYIVNTAVRLLSIGSSFILMRSVIGEISVEVWGEYSLFIALLGLVSIVILFGNHNLILSKNSFWYPYFYVDRLTKSILVSLTCFLLLIACGLYLESRPYIFAGLSIPFYVINKYKITFFQKKHKFNWLSIFNADSYLNIALLPLFIVTFYYTSNSFLLLLSTVIIWAFGLLFLPKIRLRNILPDKRYFLGGFKFMLGGTLLLVMGYMDSLLISFFLDNYFLGIYNVIFKISSLATIFLAILNSILSGDIADQYLKNKNLLQGRVLSLNRFNLSVTIGLLIVVLVFTVDILRLFNLNSADIQIAIIPLVVLFIGYVINSACGSVGYILQMTNNVNLFNRSILIAFTLNIIGNIILIPILGILGAAIASTLSMGVWNLLSAYYAYTRLELRML